MSALHINDHEFILSSENSGGGFLKKNTNIEFFSDIHGFYKYMVL